MDIICTRCGEPWDVCHVLHEDPTGFQRKGCLIARCPSCETAAPELSKQRRDYLLIVIEMAGLHGADIDGFASWLEDHPEEVVTAMFEKEKEQAVQAFPLGRLLWTPGALSAIEDAHQSPKEFLVRHVRRDWGELSDDDREENEFSLKEGFRIFSAYRTAKGVKLWVITEADRSATTILLPEEY